MSAPRSVMVAILALSLAAGSEALAQAGGGARSQSGSPAQGGSSGAGANTSGAGGVSNPDPGGERFSLGDPSNSAGPGATRDQRSGYLGGRTEPEPSGDGATVTSVLPGPARADVNCHEANPGGMSPTARLSGPNMNRIDQAGAVVGGVRARTGTRTGTSKRYLLANFQEELAKPHPDMPLAATYLGIAATGPLTPEVVLRAADLLCVPISRDQAASLSSIAEGERLRMQAGSRR